jgi:superfamily II DNA or RNA helicase
MFFPDIGDADFAQHLLALQEYQIFAMPKSNTIHSMEEYNERVLQACRFEKTSYQHLMHHYLSYRSPYRGLLLFHGLGVGKTCSAITIAEGLIGDAFLKDEPNVWVVLSNTLKDSFEGQVFNTATLMDPATIMDQCTQDTYRRMVHGVKDTEKMAKNIQGIIKARYRFFTYEKFAKEIARLERDGKLAGKIQNKVLIVDEAHNLRANESEKDTALAVMKFAQHGGKNNRIVLLSATPMYNEAEELLWLLNVLLMNDLKDPAAVKARMPRSLFDKSGQQLQDLPKLRELCARYVSYIRGTNPFTFAARFSPERNGIPVLRASWTDAVRDGIVATELGAAQKAAMPKIEKSDVSQMQAANVCYPLEGGGAKIGEKGFERVFTQVDGDKPIQVRYSSAWTGREPFYPDNIGTHASKIARVCQFVQKAEGIVIIYSQFVWSGVVPMAIALEHLGFRRYGARGLLERPRLVDDPVRYPGIPFPSYCVLSSDPSIMGDTNIKTLVQQVNTDNAHGEKIKVIVITPVAGEGLNFKNIREVHILDPWYHLNRLDQVIGRAIRNCSHIGLPVPERNVTVFLHAGVGGPTSPDLHAYEIAAGKAAKMKIVEEFIRDNAMDCALMRHLNHVPRELFEFDVMMKTSQGTAIAYHFGDAPEHEPKCAAPKESSDATMRYDAYAELLPTLLQRLRKYIDVRMKRDNIYRFSRDELEITLKLASVQRDVIDMILAKACEPDAVIKGWTLTSHMQGFVMRPPAVAAKPVIVRLAHIADDTASSRESEDSESRVCKGVENMIASIAADDKASCIFQIYTALTKDCWAAAARRIVKYGDSIPERISKQVAHLTAEGIFITKADIGQRGRGLIGFVDIFDVANLSATIVDEERGGFRDATAEEIARLKASRVERPFPFDERQHMVGVLEPDKKGMMVFKLWDKAKAGAGTKLRGMVCTSAKKPALEDHLKDIGAGAAKGSKDQLCFILAVELYRHGRLFMRPFWKPKN